MLWLSGVLWLARLAPAADFSPDGQWLAYVLPAVPASQAIAPGWLLGGPSRPAAWTEAWTRGRLWATRVNDGRSVLLAEVPGPISPPSWSPDGRAVAFLGSAPLEAADPTIEVVVQTGPEQKRVLRRLDLPGTHWLEAPAWSPDGRWLAIATPGPGGLQVLDSQAGTVLVQWSGAHSPSWSTDGRLAFLRHGERSGLWIWDPKAGAQARLLAEARMPELAPAPIWDRNGQSVWHVVAAGLATRTAGAPGPTHRGPQWQLRLVRTGLATGQAEAVLNLPHPRLASLEQLQAFALALDLESQEGYSAVSVRGEPTLITWSRIRTGETVKRFHPVHETVPIRALRLAPAGVERRLLIELGRPTEPPLAPLLCQPETEWCEAMVPDASAQALWYALLLEAMADALRGQPPPGNPGTGLDRRPSRLPLPGEFPDEHPTLIRLKRLARLGRSSEALLEPVTAGSATAERTPGLEEARFVFDAIGDKPESLRSRLESAPELAAGQTPTERLRRLGLLAQLLMAEGRLTQAEAILDYLRTQVDAFVSLDEHDTPQVEPIDRSDGWIESLANHLQMLRSPHARAADAESTLDLSATPGLDPEPGAGEAGGFPARLVPANPPGIPRPPRPGLPAPEPDA